MHGGPAWDGPEDESRGGEVRINGADRRQTKG